MFDQELNIQVSKNAEEWSKDIKGDFVIFRRINQSEANNETDNSTYEDNSSQKDATVMLSVNEVASEDIIFSNFDDLESQLSGLYTTIGDNFRCTECGFLTNDMTTLFDHILQKHSESESRVVCQASSQKGNVHVNPQWKDDLKQNFDDLIINKCSEVTRIAWQTKETISDRAKFLDVRKEILKLTMDHIVAVYGIVSSPKVHCLESVVKDILAVGYPFMFGDSDTSASNDRNLGFGYGAGGLNGVKHLPKQMWDRIYQKQTALRRLNTGPKDDLDLEDESRASSTKGRKPFKYGEYFEF